ncbi:MAG: hypothetical protein CMH35_01680 [Microbacterium sp.]|nr:hypothetical protein [Microbacterium sp.]
MEDEMNAIDQARAALASMERIGDDGWCLCVSSSAQSEVESALRELLAAHERAREALVDMAQNGLRFDLNPTLMMGPDDSVYAQWARYAQRMDASVRDHAARALVPTIGGS